MRIEGTILFFTTLRPKSEDVLRILESFEN